MLRNASTPPMYKVFALRGFTAAMRSYQAWPRVKFELLPWSIIVGTVLTDHELVALSYRWIEVQLFEPAPWNKAYTTLVSEGATAISIRCHKLAGVVTTPLALGVMLTHVPVLPVLVVLMEYVERYIPPLLPFVPNVA